ncbi:hypothetical protein L7F22_065284 [Adiantum nelumboides]|nr:hypothetical protein [Adiantum nelumboides]
MIWYFDSGASRHITSRKDLFCSLDAAPAGKKVTCANNASNPIKGVSKILITISEGSDLCLPDVLYVPGIKKNLLSVSSLAMNGLRVIFEDDRCIVRDQENGYSLITTGTLENGLFVLDCYEKQIQACIAETKTQAMQDVELWHARFGHVGYGSLMTLQRHNMDGSVRATRKLQLVHSDVCGPMRMPSVGNSLYFVTFIDEFSRFCWVYPLKAKSDVFANFQHYVSMVENETGCKVQTLRTDRGGEYMSGAFKDFLGKKGIKHQCTMPYTPQHNGVTKKKNRSLMEMARCMLKAKSLPHKLWMEAIACATHVLSRCPTRALKTITPYESWAGSSKKDDYYIKRFDGTNFIVWKHHMMDVLVNKELVAPLNDRKEGAYNDDQWEELDTRARATIWLHLGKSIFFTIMDKTTAFELWDSLCSAWDGKSASNKVFLMKKLMRLSMKEGSNVNSHLNEFNALYSQLTSKGLNFDDEMKAIFSYAHYLHHGIFSTQPLVTLHMVASLLLEMLLEMLLVRYSLRKLDSVS